LLAQPTSDLVVLDTDVVSFLFKQDSRAHRYAPHLLGKILVISAQTRAELYAWPAERNWGTNQRALLENYIEDHFFVEFPDDRICRQYGELVVAARRLGIQVPAGDAWQAATALSLGVPLVTHNARHFRGISNLLLINEPD
jgi:tRNA(fMet)-specific endonuclease VapC